MIGFNPSGMAKRNYATPQLLGNFNNFDLDT
jgi:hypothetical protein